MLAERQFYIVSEIQHDRTTVRAWIQLTNVSHLLIPKLARHE